MSAPLRIALNGFGRIGRSVLRAAYEEAYEGLEIVAINSPAPIAQQRRLLQYDSVHGRFSKPVRNDGNQLIVDNHPIHVLHERDIHALPWNRLGVDIVLECTGKFTTRHDLEKHLGSGAKKVILSAPAKSDDVPTYVYGVNHTALKSEDTLFSIGSCTTNCLAPIAQLVHEHYGIEAGFMTTIHSYTADQNLVDGSHTDPQRARAAALSMIPTSTGAARTLGKVLPELAGRLDGTAIRVPTPNVSMIDLTFHSQRPMRLDDVKMLFTGAAQGAYHQVLHTTHEPLVSIDFNHSRASATIDLNATHIIGDHFGRIAAWYDNEWGFSCRMLDLALLAGKHLQN